MEHRTGARPQPQPIQRQELDTEHGISLRSLALCGDPEPRTASLQEIALPLLRGDGMRLDHDDAIPEGDLFELELWE